MTLPREHVANRKIAKAKIVSLVFIFDNWVLPIKLSRNEFLTI